MFRKHKKINDMFHISYLQMIKSYSTHFSNIKYVLTVRQQHSKWLHGYQVP